MNKKELVSKIAEKASITKKEALKAIDAFVEVVKESLQSGDEVAINGFGTFKVAKRASKNAVNPRTGERIVVPEKKVPVFRTGKTLKELVK